MNPSASSTVPPRRYGKWIVLGLVVLVTPLVVLGVGVWSLLSLDRDAALLRREVAAASGSDWRTKVQMDLGYFTLGTARTVLRFVQHKDIEDARLALSAVRHASVGVYQRGSEHDDFSATKLFGETDRLMRKRGWSRLVGVADGNDNVLVYTSDRGNGDKIDVCLAVVNGREMVVVSTRIESEALAKLVEKHAPDDFKSKLKLAKLSF